MEAKVLKGDTAINEHILEFFKRASTIEVVSHDASWIESSTSVQKEIKRLVKNSTSVDIWIGKTVVGNKFESLGMNVKHYNLDTYKPNARFTIINRGRAGAEQLAISTGTNKEHEIYIFNNSDHPYMIALAKDILYLLEGNEKKLIIVTIFFIEVHRFCVIKILHLKRFLFLIGKSIFQNIN